MKTNMKKSLFALLSASVAASAASVYDNQKLMESKVDSINAKRGLEIDGSIRAVAQKVTFETDQDPTGINAFPETERNEYATADLGFHFRPYEGVRANAEFRLGAGMQEYFSSASKTASVGWINVEGNIGQSFYWIVGDFRQQYSPLTLYTPGIDVMYEPTIFARKRHMAMKEQRVEGNQRNLQGANIQFRGNLGESVGELRLEALFARLNRNAVLDFNGAEGNILPNEQFAGASMASNTDKWLVAGNIELLPLSKNLYVGVTPMYIFDDEKSSAYAYRHPSEQDLALNPDLEENDYYVYPVNPYDLSTQETMVISARVGGDIAGVIGNSNLILDLVGEYAMSSDKIKGVDSTESKNKDGETVVEEIETSETLDGSAILVQLNAGYKTSSFGAKLSVDFIRNDSAWFNNAAQSPSFFAQRIMNSDRDGNVVKYGVYAPLYNTFDALYNYAPKFSPVSRSGSMATEGPDLLDKNYGQSDSYKIAPYNKNSYGNNIYNRSQLALLELLNDPALQMSLPNGLATANRMGARGILTVNVGEWVEAQGLFSMFNQVTPFVGFKEASYTEFGGGAKVDVFKALGFTLPLEISGSYKHSERSIDSDIQGKDAVNGTAEAKSDFINAGLYVQYLPRLGFTAGFQMVNTEYNVFEQSIYTGKLLALGAEGIPMVKSEQMQWMVGLDYSVAKNAWLALNFGIVSVSNQYAAVQVADDKTEVKAVNVPDYYDGTAGAFKHEFTQTILEASINVEF